MENRVLLVDGEKEIRIFVSEALTRSEREPVDLLLTDPILPTTEGF